MKTDKDCKIPLTTEIHIKDRELLQIFCEKKYIAKYKMERGQYIVFKYVVNIVKIKLRSRYSD